jgi:hypothetical protein
MSRIFLPEKLDEWARCKAAKDRTSLSAVVAEALAILKGDDPQVYGIKPGRRKQSPANQA